MNEQEKRIRLKLKNDFTHYANKCLKIRTKAGDVLPFIINRAQLHMHQLVEQQKLATGKVRCVVLKGRQMGMSTYIEGRFYWLVTHRFGRRAFILTHDSDATNNLFEMAGRYHQHCPAIVRPKADTSNAKELLFGGLDSGYKIGTAGNKAVGRSSTIQYLHGSEVAYWANASEHAKGILQTVPSDKDTEVFLESTANGLGNYFHEQWQLAEAKQSEFIPIFVPWYWQPEYQKEPHEDFALDDEEIELISLYSLTYEQLAWRRYKIAELSVGGNNGQKAFQQEYPNTSTEAFIASGEDIFIDPAIAMGARKGIAEPWGNLIVGVDPARFGDDRTSIIRRKGRVAYGLESYSKKDTMEICGLVHRIILDEHPTKVCIDIGGLGAGVYDRLRELGHDQIIIAVNSGNTPLDQKRYINKRSEMWGEMREWLLDKPCVIPDIDSLHSDLCGIKYKFDSKTRLVLERKEDMKKRGIRSPDEADALALTFAIPSMALSAVKQKDTQLAKNIMSTYSKVDRLRKSAYT